LVHGVFLLVGQALHGVSGDEFRRGQAGRPGVATIVAIWFGRVPQSKSRIESLIAIGEKDGAKVLLDGRNSKVTDCECGNFVKPTVLDNVPALADTEIFSPVLSLVYANYMGDALAFLERNAYGTKLRCLLQAELSL
jgi:hypothetical protein